MSESESGSVFDLDQIRKLAELMKETELSELELRENDHRIRLRRGGEVGPIVSAPAPIQAASSAPAENETEDDANVGYIKSPMVGTFYGKPNPNASVYVKVGDHVDPETTVCIVEAMKVFNEIPAETSGKIIAVLVEDGAPVEFGQPLFKLEV